MPQISQALGVSLTDDQTPKEVEEEMSAGPGALRHIETHALCPGRKLRPQRRPRKRRRSEPEPCNAWARASQELLGHRACCRTWQTLGLELERRDVGDVEGTSLL